MTGCPLHPRHHPACRMEPPPQPHPHPSKGCYPLLAVCHWGESMQRLEGWWVGESNSTGGPVNEADLGTRCLPEWCCVTLCFGPKLRMTWTQLCDKHADVVPLFFQQLHEMFVCLSLGPKDWTDLEWASICKSLSAAGNISHTFPSKVSVSNLFQLAKCKRRICKMLIFSKFGRGSIKKRHLASFTAPRFLMCWNHCYVFWPWLELV